MPSWTLANRTFPFWQRGVFLQPEVHENTSITVPDQNLELQTEALTQEPGVKPTTLSPGAALLALPLLRGGEVIVLATATDKEAAAPAHAAPQSSANTPYDALRRRSEDGLRPAPRAPTNLWSTARCRPPP